MTQGVITEASSLGSHWRKPSSPAADGGIGGLVCSGGPTEHGGPHGGQGVSGGEVVCIGKNCEKRETNMTDVVSIFFWWLLGGS